MTDVVIGGALRTPFGKFGGALRNYAACELGGLVTAELLSRSGVAPDEVSESIFGTAVMASSTLVVARQINAKAGIPLSTPSLTIDRACCSSMTAIGLGAGKIRSGDAQRVVAGGIESCSQVPLLMRGTRWGHKLGGAVLEDPVQFRNPITGEPLARVTGESALAHGVSREEQDEWALASHQKYFASFENGEYAGELLPVPAKGLGNEEILECDESPRADTSLDKLSRLKTVYDSPTVTPGNAPGLNDGASAALLLSREEAKSRGIEPLGELISYVQLAGELDSSTYLPGQAILKALARANIGLDEIKLIEINEAFAAMPLVSTKVMAQETGADLMRLRAITNVKGGAVAIGHPTGASGARVVMTLLQSLQRLGGGYGAAAICGGFGQADAVVVKV